MGEIEATEPLQLGRENSWAKNHKSEEEFNFDNTH